MHLVGPRLQPFEESPHPIEARTSFDDLPALRRLEVFERRLHRDAFPRAEGEGLVVGLSIGVRVPRLDGPLPEGEPLVRDDQVHVDTDGSAEPVAGITGPEGRVEGEEVGHGVPVRDVAPGTVNLRAAGKPLFPGGAGVEDHRDLAFSHPKGRLQGIHDSPDLSLLQDEPVRNQVERAGKKLSEEVLGNLPGLAFVVEAEVAGTPHSGFDLGGGEGAVVRDRKGDQGAGAGDGCPPALRRSSGGSLSEPHDHTRRSTGWRLLRTGASHTRPAR